MTKSSLRFDRVEFEKRVQNFLEKTEIPYKNFDIYLLAFVHKSVLNESAEFYHESNERLEFLGDAVLELIITEKLFRDFPEKTEGMLTDIRSAVVRGRNLANIALTLGMSDAIQLSRGEYRVSGHENPYILANTLEAIIGAMYTDLGFEVAKGFILTHVYATLSNILEQGLYVDPKSYLQEISQEIWGTLPVYEVHHEEGQDHNKKYHIRVMLGDTLLGEGVGTSKKKGEQDAAENAIARRKTWEATISLPKKYI